MTAPPTRTPTYPELLIDQIPPELRERPQWGAWIWKKRPEGWAKLLINPATGKAAKVNDLSTWGTFDQALAYARRTGCGIGYVFAVDDPFTGIDVDACIDPETGEIDAEVFNHIRALDSYAELSPSNTGVHVFIRAELPPGGRRAGKIEMYDRGRWFTITGQQLPGSPPTIGARQEQIEHLHRAIFGEPSAPAPTQAPVPMTLGDEDIIRRARNAKNGAKFSRLWQGDTSDYTGDDSRADLALCSDLTFFTQDPDQIDRIFRQSGLMRPKWERPDYRERTITKALKRFDVWAPPAPSTPAQQPPAPEPAKPDPCATRLAKLEQRIADLEQELAREREARFAAEQLQSQTMAVLANPGMPDGEKITALAVIFLTGSMKSRHAAGDPGVKIAPDGFVPIYRSQIAEASGCSLSTVSCRLKRINSTGIVQTRVSRVQDNITGEWLSQLEARPSAPTREVLTKLATTETRRIDPDTGRIKTWGGQRDPRPATCPDCPDADVIVKRTMACADCGQVLGSLPDERISATVDDSVLKSQDATSEDQYPPNVEDVPRGRKMRYQGHRDRSAARSRKMPHQPAWIDPSPNAAQSADQHTRSTQ